MAGGVLVAGFGATVAVAVGFGAGLAGAAGFAGVAGFAGTMLRVSTTDFAQTVSELPLVWAAKVKPPPPEVEQAHEGRGLN
jgi:hypothetical protein